MSRKSSLPKSKYPMDLDEDSGSVSSASDSYQNAVSDDNNGASDADSILKSILPPELLKYGKPSSRGASSKRNDEEVSLSSLGSEFNVANSDRRSSKAAGSSSKSTSKHGSRTRKYSTDSLDAIMAGLGDKGVEMPPPSDRRSSKAGGMSRASSSKHGNKERKSPNDRPKDVDANLTEDDSDIAPVRSAKTTTGSSKSTSKHGSRTRKYSDDSVDAIMAGLSDDGREFPSQNDRGNVKAATGSSKSTNKHGSRTRKYSTDSLDAIMAGLGDKGVEMPPPSDRRSSKAGGMSRTSSKHGNKGRTPDNNLDDVMAGLSDDDIEMPPPSDRRGTKAGGSSKAAEMSNGSMEPPQAAEKSKRKQPPQPSSHQTRSEQEQQQLNRDSASNHSGRQQVHHTTDTRSSASVHFAPDTHQGDGDEDRDSSMSDSRPGRARGHQQLDRQRQQRQPQSQSLHQPQQGQLMMQRQQQQPQSQLLQPAQFTFEFPSMDSGSSQNAMSDEHMAKLKDWSQRIRECIFQSNLAIKEKETEISNRNVIIRNMQDEITKLKRDFELTNISYQSEKDGRTSIEKRVNGLHHLCVSLKDNVVSMDSVVKAVKFAHANAQAIVQKYQQSFKVFTDSLGKLEKNLIDSKAVWTEKFRQQQEASAAELAAARTSYEALTSQMVEKSTMLDQCQATLTKADEACELLQRRTNELETLLEQTSTEKQILQTELDAKKQQLQSADEVNTQLQSALNDLGDKCDNLTVQVRTVSEAKAAVETELSDIMVAHQSQVAELEGQLMECRLETDELKIQIKALSDDLDECNCSMTELSDNLSSVESEVGRQARELSDLARQRDELKAQVESLELANAECESQGEAAAAEADRLRDKLLADEELADSLKAQINELNNLVEEARAEAIDKVKQLEQRDELNKSLQDEIQQLKEAKASISDRIIDMECELVAVKFDSDEKLHQLELSICDLEQQLIEKKSEADHLSEQAAALAGSRDEATRRLADSAAAAESVGAALSRREAELHAAESRAAEAAARADSLQSGELPRLRAALAEAEARADKSEKSAASLAQELAAAGAAVREKDARLDDLRQELGGLRDAMAQGSASMKSEFAAMLERLCEEKDRQLADREGELANLMERTRQGASTKSKPKVVADDLAGKVMKQDGRIPTPRSSPKPSPTNDRPNALSQRAVSAAATPAISAPRTPKSTPGSASAPTVDSSSQPPAQVPERQLNLKSPRSILRRQDPDAKRRKVHFNERNNTVSKSQGAAADAAKSPGSGSNRTTRRLVLSPTVPPPSVPAPAQPVVEAENEDSGDGFWFDSDLIFGNEKA